MSIFAKEYEQYIISGFREESLSTLVPGSDADKYLKILRKINSAEEAMSTEVNIISIFKLLVDRRNKTVFIRVQ